MTARAERAATRTEDTLHIIEEGLTRVTCLASCARLRWTWLAAFLLASGCVAPVDEASPDDAMDLGEDEAALTEKPSLWMPFPAGWSRQCTQGNNGSVSHSFSSTKHALDFDTPNIGAAEAVVAALAGRVGFVQTGCAVGNTSCGAGFGNHVKLEHGGGYYTMYAHLSSVSVAVGDKVGRGQLIGHEGTTGNSSGDHLHFSLHQGNASVLSVAPTVSYFLRARDATTGGGFTSLGSGSFTCGLPGGHFYESDNACPTLYNTRSSAKTITSNIAYLGETCTFGDVDYFTFTGGSGSFTSAARSTSQSIFDCSCAILDAQGVELPQNGPQGYTRNDGYNGSEGCSCSLTSSTPGQKYYLKIFAQMPGGYILEKTLP